MYQDTFSKFVGEPGAKAPLVEVDPASLDGLEAFWASKPAQEPYPWFHLDKCALAQWRNSVDAGACYVTMLANAGVNNSMEFEHEVAYPQPHSFGAALKRLREYRARNLLSERNR